MFDDAGDGFFIGILRITFNFCEIIDFRCGGHGVSLLRGLFSPDGVSPRIRSDVYHNSLLNQRRSSSHAKSTQLFDKSEPKTAFRQTISVLARRLAENRRRNAI